MGDQCHPHETCTTTNQVSQSWVIDVLETKDTISFQSKSSMQFKPLENGCENAPFKCLTGTSVEQQRDLEKCEAMHCQVSHSGLS